MSFSSSMSDSIDFMEWSLEYLLTLTTFYTSQFFTVFFNQWFSELQSFVKKFVEVLPDVWKSTEQKIDPYSHFLVVWYKELNEWIKLIFCFFSFLVTPSCPLSNIGDEVLTKLPLLSSIVLSFLLIVINFCESFIIVIFLWCFRWVSQFIGEKLTLG